MSVIGDIDIDNGAIGMCPFECFGYCNEICFAHTYTNTDRKHIADASDLGFDRHQSSLFLLLWVITIDKNSYYRNQQYLTEYDLNSNGKIFKHPSIVVVL